MNASLTRRPNAAWNVLFAFALIVFALFSHSKAHAWGGKSVAGSGNVIEDVRIVSGFTRVELKGAMDVELRQGAREGVTIIADDNIAPLVRTTVSGKKLTIDSNASWSTRTKMRVIVEAPKFEGLSVSGAGDVRASSLQSAELEVSIAGSGDVTLESLTVDALSVRIAGSGDFRASGSAKAQTYSIAGSGDVRAEGLEGTNVNVRIAGSGDARVWAKMAIDATVMGSGDVRYKGKPTNVNKRVMGSGDVSPL
jgi:hypothetical protein